MMMNFSNILVIVTLLLLSVVDKTNAIGVAATNDDTAAADDDFQLPPLLDDKSYQDPDVSDNGIGGSAVPGMIMTASNSIPLIASTDSLERTYGQSHFNEAFPSKIVTKGDPNAYYELPYATHFDTINEEFNSIMVSNYKYFNDGQTAFEPITEEINMKDMMEITSTDGILIMKDGVVIVEQYRNGFDPYTRHNAFSMTKSFAGVMVSMLIEDGTIESENDLVIKYIPELDIDGGAFQDATIREVLDMTTQFIWNEAAVLEDCEERVAKLFYYGNNETDANDIPTGVGFPVPLGCEQFFDLDSRTPTMKTPEYWLNITNGMYSRYPGPQNSKDSVMNLKTNPDENNGEVFNYRTANTQVLGWLIENLTDGQSTKYFSDNLWSKVGQGSDSLMLVDSTGFPFWGGGSQHTLRDAARYGDMMRNGGKNHLGEQLVPSSIVDDIKVGGNIEGKQFANGSSGCMNCAWSASPELCLCGSWPGDGTIPDDVPVMKYLNSIGDMATEEELQYGISTGMAYRNQYWILSEHMFKQEGVFGQRVAVFPKIGLVIAMFGSQPTEGDQYFDHMNMVFEMAAEYANVTITSAAAAAATAAATAAADDDGAVDEGNIATAVASTTTSSATSSAVTSTIGLMMSIILGTFFMN